MLFCLWVRFWVRVSFAHAAALFVLMRTLTPRDPGSQPRPSGRRFDTFTYSVFCSSIATRAGSRCSCEAASPNTCASNAAIRSQTDPSLGRPQTSSSAAMRSGSVAPGAASLLVLLPLPPPLRRRLLHCWSFPSVTGDMGESRGAALPLPPPPPPPAAACCTCVPTRLLVVRLMRSFAFTSADAAHA